MEKYKVLTEYLNWTVNKGDIIQKGDDGRWQIWGVVIKTVITTNFDIIMRCYPEWFKKVDDNDYKILQYNHGHTVAAIQIPKITKVIRLHDEEIFSVGDYIEVDGFSGKKTKVEIGKFSEERMDDNSCLLKIYSGNDYYITSLSSAVKIKPSGDYYRSKKDDHFGNFTVKDMISFAEYYAERLKSPFTVEDMGYGIIDKWIDEKNQKGL